ncbi:hypothetical protein [Xenorhabdus sp. SGI240]|uniref:hypothetical protein n=1 Tax=Xenorhabdus sp. SGI240 TaxID=3158262 RepID=UPI0032B84DCB
MAQIVAGQSPYLTTKGLHCPNQRLLPDNSAVLALTTLDAGNLLFVAKAVRERWLDIKIIIAADNDWHSPANWIKTENQK